MIKRKFLLRPMFVLASLISSVSFAQDIPTVGPFTGGGNGPGGSLIGDTIIIVDPTLPGNLNHAPAVASCISAVYYSDFIAFISSGDVTCSYAIRTEEGYYILRNQLALTNATPEIVDISSLPSGRHTLLIYINGECLEGEFGKE